MGNVGAWESEVLVSSGNANLKARLVAVYAPHYTFACSEVYWLIPQGTEMCHRTNITVISVLSGTKELTSEHTIMDYGQQTGTLRALRLRN